MTICPNRNWKMFLVCLGEPVFAEICGIWLYSSDIVRLEVATSRKLGAQLKSKSCSLCHTSQLKWKASCHNWVLKNGFHAYDTIVPCDFLDADKYDAEILTSQRSFEISMSNLKSILCSLSFINLEKIVITGVASVDSVISVLAELGKLRSLVRIEFIFLDPQVLAKSNLSNVFSIILQSSIAHLGIHGGEMELFSIQLDSCGEVFQASLMVPTKLHFITTLCSLKEFLWKWNRVEFKLSIHQCRMTLSVETADMGKFQSITLPWLQNNMTLFTASCVRDVYTIVKALQPYLKEFRSDVAYGKGVNYRFERDSLHLALNFTDRLHVKAGDIELLRCLCVILAVETVAIEGFPTAQMMMALFQDNISISTAENSAAAGVSSINKSDMTLGELRGSFPPVTSLSSWNTDVWVGTAVINSPESRNSIYHALTMLTLPSKKIHLVEEAEALLSLPCLKTVILHTVSGDALPLIIAKITQFTDFITENFRYQGLRNEDVISVGFATDNKIFLHIVKNCRLHHKHVRLTIYDDLTRKSTLTADDPLLKVDDNIAYLLHSATATATASASEQQEGNSPPLVITSLDRNVSKATTVTAENSLKLMVHPAYHTDMQYIHLVYWFRYDRDVSELTIFNLTTLLFEAVNELPEVDTLVFDETVACDSIKLKEICTKSVVKFADITALELRKTAVSGLLLSLLTENTRLDVVSLELGQAPNLLNSSSSIAMNGIFTLYPLLQTLHVYDVRRKHQFTVSLSLLTEAAARCAHLSTLYVESDRYSADEVRATVHKIRDNIRIIYNCRLI